MADVEALAQAACAPGFNVDAKQSNWEGQLIDWTMRRGKAVGIVINPGAFTHTSVAILDALNALEGPVIEVHISQVVMAASRSGTTLLARRADAVIAGLGVDGHAAAVARVCKLVG